MNNSFKLFCSTCGDMKKILYKYIGDNLHINFECIKEEKKSTESIESFLNDNKYKSNPRLICNLHKSQYTNWCTFCNINICDKCLSQHNSHQLIKLSSILINNNDIDLFQIKVTNFHTRLNEKKRVIDEKNIFNEKQENEFLNNFQKYYKLNICQIAFVQKIKELYLYLIQNNMICYQIIMNLKYLIDKVNSNFSNNVFNEDTEIKNQTNDGEMNDIIDIYYIVFHSHQYCLLPNNEKEENEREAEEKQKSMILERSGIIDLSKEIDSFSLDSIPLTESIKLNDDIIRAKSLNAYNFIFNNNKNPFNNNNINDNSSSSLINSSSDIDSNFCLLKTHAFTQNDFQKEESKNKQIFKGTYKNGKYHGDRCRLIYPDGFIYEGSFREGLRHGTGVLFNNSKLYKYQGGWTNDKKDGKCIEIIDGEKFEGLYKNGIREGKCIITYSNKDKFIGNLVNGKKEGYGEQFYFKTNTTYKGEFKNNLYEGKGEIINNNGYYFKGEFLAGLRHGDNCIETKKGIKKYEGQFRRDKMNGKGIYEWYSGESKGDIYNGEFKDDLFEGFGTYKYNNGTIYIGEYLHGIRHGKGKIIYIDGSFYEGDYNEGQQTGKGIYQDFEGNIYEGNFYNGNKHSKGKIKYINGEILEGLWLNGLKEGNFYFIDQKGNKYFRKYVKDELIEETKEGFISSVFNGIFGKITSIIK